MRYNGHVKGSEMVRLYKQSGWELVRIEGSHHMMKKGIHIEPIPVHRGKDLRKGLQEKLLKRLKEVG